MGGGGGGEMVGVWAPPQRRAWGGAIGAAKSTRRKLAGRPLVPKAPILAHGYDSTGPRKACEQLLIVAFSIK